MGLGLRVRVAGTSAACFCPDVMFVKSLKIMLHTELIVCAMCILD